MIKHDQAMLARWSTTTTTTTTTTNNNNNNNNNSNSNNNNNNNHLGNQMKQYMLIVPASQV